MQAGGPTTTTEPEGTSMSDERLRKLEQDLLEETKRLCLLQAQLLRGVEDLMSSVRMVLLEASHRGVDDPS
jgi:hypothetical protein